MKQVLRLLIISIAFATAQIAHAKEYTFTVDIDFYAGASYAFLGYQETGVEAADLSAALLIGGVEFYDWLALEARVGYGNGTDTIEFNQEAFDISLRTIYGVYMKGRCPTFFGPFSPYVISGYTSVDTKVESTQFGVISGSESGLGFGGGIDFDPASGWNSVVGWINKSNWQVPNASKFNQIRMNMEYMQYIDNSTLSLGGLNMGIKYNF